MHTLLKITTLIVAITIISCNGKKENKKQANLVSLTKPTKKKSISVGKNPDAMFLIPRLNKMYVANANDNYVSIIDTKSDVVIGKIEGLNNSWGFSAIHNKPLVALTTYKGQVTIINIENDSIVREKKHPHELGDVTTSNDGKYLYIVAIDTKKVLKINIETLEEEGSYDTGGDPDGIDISKDGSTLFVTNRADGTISSINMLKNKTVLIKTGGKPELINSNDDRSLVYASNFDLNTMHVIDTKKSEVTATITGLNGPEGAHYSLQDQTLYIANFNTNEVFAYKDNDYSKIIKKYTTGKNPLSIVSSKGKLYVSCYGDNTISVIDK